MWSCGCVFRVQNPCRAVRESATTTAHSMRATRAAGGLESRLRCVQVGEDRGMTVYVRAPGPVDAGERVASAGRWFSGNPFHPQPTTGGVGGEPMERVNLT